LKLIRQGAQERPIDYFYVPLCNTTAVRSVFD
jgi:hypothetical protein